MHEMDEILGGGLELDGSAQNAPPPTTIEPLDLFRFTSTPGVRSFDTTDDVGDTVPSAESFFSIDGGVTDLAQFNQHAGGDFGDWWSFYGGNVPEVQDAYTGPNVQPDLGVELVRLDVMGYSRQAPDLTLNVTDNVSGAMPYGGSYTWDLHVSNIGNASATFTAAETLVGDNLPSSNANYGVPVVANEVGITGAGTITPSIVANNLTALASGGNVTIGVGGSFDIKFTVTPTATGTFADPRPAASPRSIPTTSSPKAPIINRAAIRSSWRRRRPRSTSPPRPLAAAASGRASRSLPLLPPRQARPARARWRSPTTATPSATAPTSPSPIPTR